MGASDGRLWFGRHAYDASCRIPPAGASLATCAVAQPTAFIDCSSARSRARCSGETDPARAFSSSGSMGGGDSMSPPFPNGSFTPIASSCGAYLVHTSPNP